MKHFCITFLKQIFEYVPVYLFVKGLKHYFSGKYGIIISKVNIWKGEKIYHADDKGRT